MADFSRTGKWEVVIEKRDGEEEKHIFDAVICCSGHYTYPNMPLKDFPGNHLAQSGFLDQSRKLLAAPQDNQEV